MGNALSRILFMFFLCGALGACGNSDKEKTNYFRIKAEEVLAKKESTTIKISSLTNFDWDKVCFERNKDIKLIFHHQSDVFNMDLDFDHYFIDEGYVDRSPDGKCYKNDVVMELRLEKNGDYKQIKFIDIEIIK